MNKQSTLKLVMTALFTALCTLATMMIQIPTPTKGYIHLGDAMVLLSGLCLGPIYGGIAAGFGSALADAFTGYLIPYGPATLLIKATAAIITGFIGKKLLQNRKPTPVPIVFTTFFGAITIVLGYFLFETFYSMLVSDLTFNPALLYGLSSVPANILQVATGMVIATILYPLLARIPVFIENIKKVQA